MNGDFPGLPQKADDEYATTSGIDARVQQMKGCQAKTATKQIITDDIFSVDASL